MQYTQKEMETALNLQRLLITAGVDADYVTLQVRLVQDRLSENVTDLVSEILKETPEKWRTLTADEAIRQQVEKEKADPRTGGGGKAVEQRGKEYWEQFRANVRKELDVKSAARGENSAAELNRRAGRAR